MFKNLADNKDSNNFSNFTICDDNKCSPRLIIIRYEEMQSLFLTTCCNFIGKCQAREHIMFLLYCRERGTEINHYSLKHVYVSNGVGWVPWNSTERAFRRLMAARLWETHTTWGKPFSRLRARCAIFLNEHFS